MKKEIRLLIENLFNDEIFNRDEYDQDIEVGLSQIAYKIGEVLYENKKPYAICCGKYTDFQFTDDDRFILIQDELPLLRWCMSSAPDYCIKEYENKDFYKNNKDEIEEIVHKEDMGELDADNYDKKDPVQKMYFGFYVNNWLNMLEIDEYGYENTLLIKNKYNIKNYPAIEYCCKLGDNVYLPSIDELQILCCSFNKITDIKYDFIKKSGLLYWSSTTIWSCAYAFAYDYIINRGYVNLNNYRFYGMNYVLPFVKI